MGTFLYGERRYIMKRFVKHFYAWYDEPPIEDQITNYAETNNLKIITITAMNGNGLYVLFEENERGEK